MLPEASRPEGTTRRVAAGATSCSKGRASSVLHSRTTTCKLDNHSSEEVLFMDEAAILDKIREVVADKLDADPGDVVDSASFVDDLGADSLDVVELIMGLEDEFGIEISDEEAEKLSTVGEAVRFIASQQ